MTIFKSQNQKLKVGFIGLGLMGNPMAKNILKARFPLTVYNRTKSKTQEVEKLGAKVANSPKEVGENSDVVITMVTGPQEVEECVLGKSGVVQGAHPGLIVIDMSTIGPKSAVKIFSQLGDRGVEFLDAPVTGSTPKAITGELTVFIGGKPDIYEKTKPVLSSLGTSLFYIGGSGRGQAIKLINNLIVAESMAALAEGMLLADAEGLERSKVAEVLENVPALSPFQKLKLGQMVKEDFPALFSIANMVKDLRLALKELPAGFFKLPFLSKVQEVYERAKKNGSGDKDIAAILEELKRI